MREDTGPLSFSSDTKGTVNIQQVTKTGQNKATPAHNKEQIHSFSAVLSLDVWPANQSKA